MELNLGDTARDSITGFEGIIQSRYIFINGCLQFSLRPRVDKDGKLQDAHSFDVSRLELVEQGTVRPTAVQHSDTADFGDLVECEISGLRGIVVSKHYYFDGTIGYGVQPPARDSAIPETSCLDSTTIKMITTKKKAVRPNYTGGPMDVPLRRGPVE